jgi:hypothetical protein
MSHLNSFAVVSKSTAASGRSVYLRGVLFALLISTAGVFLRVDAKPPAQNSPAPPQGASRTTPKKRHRLRITKGEIIGISLKADKAKMSEIAADLAKRLGAQVILGPNMAKETITVEFYDLPLEAALRLLVPHVYIDYEIKENAQPTMLGIFLSDSNDPEPAATAVVQGSSQAMMIEGNTEDTPDSVENSDNDPLQVELDDNHLTIKSKKQPLVAVVLTIAELLGVPAEIKYESAEIVDTEIKDTPFEDAITRLSPNIRLYVRADLTRSKRTALRLTLVPPVAKVSEAATNK